MWYNLSVSAYALPAPLGGEVSPQVTERLYNGRPFGNNEAPIYFP